MHIICLALEAEKEKDAETSGGSSKRSSFNVSG